MSKQREKRHGEPVAREAGLDMSERVEFLRELFPEAFAEGKVDWDKLKIALGEAVDAGPERYSFTWAGKRDAIRLLQMPSRATLNPARDESVDWDTTKNAFIEGDNLEVLKLLLKPYYGQVKMIYIDPPYNTGNDFVYPDNYADPLDTYLKLTGQKDSDGNLLTTNADTSGRYHSAWLSMMYPRLFLAKQLLREDGVLFVSIDDNEFHNLRFTLNEVFGEENFVASITVEGNPRGRDYGGVARMHDYLLIYSKSELSELRGLENPDKTFPYSDAHGGFEVRELRNRNIAFHIGNRPNLHYPFYVNENKKDSNGFFEIALEPQPGWREVYPKESQGYKTVWRWGKERAAKYLNTEIVAKKMGSGDYQIVEKYRKTTKLARTIWTDKDVNTEKGTLLVKELFDAKVFSFPKPVEMMQRIVEMSTSDDDLILDFFGGSSTTAHAVFLQNRSDGGSRNFILVQLPEPTEPQSQAHKSGFHNLAMIGAERIRRAIKVLKSDKQNKLKLSERSEPEDLGFRVYKLAESNYKPWTGVEDNDPDKYAAELEMFADPLKDEWTPVSVMHEVAVKEGYGLGLNIAQVDGVKSNKVYRVSDPDKEQSFFICLDNKLDPQTPRELALQKDDTFVCRDIAMTDELEANLALQCRLKTV